MEMTLLSAPTVKIMIGDALEKLKELPEKSVQCVITSPPYFGLRSYSVCECALTTTPNPTCPDCKGTGTLDVVAEKEIGQEKTPTKYIERLMTVFEEIKRVLRDDGTLWVVIGDSYAGSNKGKGTTKFTPKQASNAGSLNLSVPDWKSIGIRPKSLICIPWRLGFAFMETGWILRSDVILNKLNCMTESVKDRPTHSHEYILFLTKEERYFYDGEDVREPYKYDGRRDTMMHGSPKYGGLDGAQTVQSKGHERWPDSGRNLRSVWSIPTAQYKGNHFAVFAVETVERCIKAGTSQKGCCPRCSAPWKRIIEKHYPPTRKVLTKTPPGQSAQGNLSDTRWDEPIESQTVGWQPTCECLDAGDPVPCLVLDPFAGSGTTGEVARNLGRSSILIELNPQYEAKIAKRVKPEVKPFTEFGRDEGRCHQHPQSRF